MKNIKIKSYSFKKNSVLNKDGGTNSSLSANKIILQKTNLPNTPHRNDLTGTTKYDSISNKLIDINFYEGNNGNKVKSSLLSIQRDGSVTESITNEIIPNQQIQMNTKNTMNTFKLNNNTSSKLSEITNSVNQNYNKELMSRTGEKINIKLNINSEIINNNISIKGKNQGENRSSGQVIIHKNYFRERRQINLWKNQLIIIY
jgi:hypothetical protein